MDVPETRYAKSGDLRIAYQVVHPVLTHVPPNRARSITATCIPRAAIRRASEGPAWPVPMMIASCQRVRIGDLSRLGRH
jgi:hypothetical protein